MWLILPIFCHALTLDDALARAQQRAPIVQLAVAQEAEAQAVRMGAGVFMPQNPMLYGELRPALTGPFEFGWAANAQFMFEPFGGWAARIQLAQAALAASQAQTAFERFDARFTAWKQYVDIRATELRIAATTEAIAGAERTKRASEERASAGAASDIDLVTSEAELATFVAMRERAKAELERHIAELKHTLDIDPQEGVELSTDITVLPALSSETPLTDETLEKRPEIVAIRTRMEAYAAAHKRYTREALPKVGLFLGADAAPVSPIFGQIGLALEIPVAQRNQAPRALAEAQRQTEMTKLTLELRRLRREYDARKKEYAARREELRVLDETAIPAARRNVALVEVGWRAGRFDIFRLTSAMRILSQLLLERVDVLAQAWDDRIQLEKISRLQ
jgi:cobalt-zinc-cadmium efflux system outer membrane protein